MRVKFRSVEHKEFFLKCMNECSNQDSYHQAFFYTVGISESCRLNFNAIYDKENDRIKPEGLYGGWQTSGSDRATRLAFNLWNGYVEEGHEKDSTPYELFTCEYAPYYMEAIKIKYPEYCRDHLSLDDKER